MLTRSQGGLYYWKGSKENQGSRTHAILQYLVEVEVAYDTGFQQEFTAFYYLCFFHIFNAGTCTGCFYNLILLPLAVEDNWCFLRICTFYDEH